jgi:lysophospholipase L1-like esterase
MTRIESLFAKAFLALLAFGVSFALLEIGARALLGLASEEFFMRYASLPQLDDRFGKARSMFVPHAYLGVVPRPSWSRAANRHNSLGFRGAEMPRSKPAGEFRIVCMGGSTTYTSAVDDWRLSYPAQLERVLREGHPLVRVVNAGVSDWTSWETVINFQTRVLDLEPDLAVVYHAINDFESRLVWPPAAYRPDNSGSRVHALEAPPRILERSTLLRFFLIRLGRSRPPARIERVLKRPESSRLIVYRNQLAAGTYPQDPFDEVSIDQILAANPPVYFRRNLENLIAIARFRGVAVVLTTMPTAPAEAHLSFAAAPDIRGIGEMNDVTRAIADEQDIALFDLAERFPADVSLFADGVHVNKRGAALHAELLARFLEERGLVAPGARVE